MEAAFATLAIRTRPFTQPQVPVSTLKTCLPKAGFSWPHDPILLRSREDDAKVREALLATTLALKTTTTEPLLTLMFEEAEIRARKGDIPRATLDTPDAQEKWLARIRRSIPWAVGAETGVSCGWKVFALLFLAIRDARLRWFKQPLKERSLPHNTALHGRLAHAVDAFNEAIGDAWADVFDDLMALAGRDEKEDVDDLSEEDVEMEDDCKEDTDSHIINMTATAVDREEQTRLLQALLRNAETHGSKVQASKEIEREDVMDMD